MRLIILTGFILSAVVISSAQEHNPLKPIPSRRLVTRGEMYHSLQEIFIDLKVSAGNKGDMAAMRICSRDPLPVAIFTAVVNPLSVGERLTHDEGSGLSFSKDRVMLLRSPDCPITDPPYVPLEFWGVPQGAALPEHAEAAKLCQVRVEGFGYQDSLKSLGAYRKALGVLSKRLKENPDAVAVIGGAYNTRPSASMRRALKYAEQFLGRSGLPHGRYFVRLKPSATYDPEYNPEPEPKYPNVLSLSLAEDCEGKKSQ